MAAVMGAVTGQIGLSESRSRIPGACHASRDGPPCPATSDFQCRQSQGGTSEEEAGQDGVGYPRIIALCFIFLFFSFFYLC